MLPPAGAVARAAVVAQAAGDLTGRTNAALAPAGTMDCTWKLP